MSIIKIIQDSSAKKYSITIINSEIILSFSRRGILNC
jgi:hypothetical protein